MQNQTSSFQLSYITIVVSDLNIASSFYENVFACNVERNDSFGMASVKVGPITLAFLAIDSFANLFDMTNQKSNSFSSLILSFQMTELDLLESILERARISGAKNIRPFRAWPWGKKAAFFEGPDHVTWELTLR